MLLKPHFMGHVAPHSRTSSTDALLAPRPSMDCAHEHDFDSGDNHSTRSKSPGAISALSVLDPAPPSPLFTSRKITSPNPNTPTPTTRNGSMSTSTPNLALSLSSTPREPTTTADASQPTTPATPAACPTGRPLSPASAFFVSSPLSPTARKHPTYDEQQQRDAKRKHRHSLPVRSYPRDGSEGNRKRDRELVLERERERVARVEEEAEAFVRASEPDPPYGAVLGLLPHANASQFSLFSILSRDSHTHKPEESVPSLSMSHTSTMTAGSSSATASASGTVATAIPAARASASASCVSLGTMTTTMGTPRTEPLKACEAVHVRLNARAARKARKERERMASSAVSLPLQSRSGRFGASTDSVTANVRPSKRATPSPSIKETPKFSSDTIRDTDRDAYPAPPIHGRSPYGSSPYGAGTMRPVAARSEAYIHESRLRSNNHPYAASRFGSRVDEDDEDEEEDDDDDDDFEHVERQYAKAPENDKTERFARLRKVFGRSETNASAGPKSETKVMRWVRSRLVRPFA